MNDSNWFGDLNRDGRADGWDDALGFWFFGMFWQRQRQLQQMAEELERRQQELDDAMLARRWRTVDDDEDDDDEWDEDWDDDLWDEADDDWDED